MLYLFLAILVSTSPGTSLEKLMKKHEKAEKVILFPEKGRYSYRHEAVSLYEKPEGKVFFKINPGIIVKVIKHQKGWIKILTKIPFVMTGWIKEIYSGLIVRNSALAYSGPSLKSKKIAYMRKGIMVYPIKKSGNFFKVNIHHHFPLQCYIHKDDLGYKYGKHKSVSFKHETKYTRYMYKVKAGAFYNKNHRKIGYLHKDAKLPVVYRGNKWVKIKSHSNDLKTFGWVQADRVGKKKTYFYSYRHKFYLKYLHEKSWLKGGFRLKKNVKGYIDENSVLASVLLTKGTRISAIYKLKNDLVVVKLSNYAKKVSTKLYSLLKYFAYNPSYSGYSFKNTPTYRYPTFHVYTSIKIDDLEPVF